MRSRKFWIKESLREVVNDKSRHKHGVAMYVVSQCVDVIQILAHVPWCGNSKPYFLRIFRQKQIQ